MLCSRFVRGARARQAHLFILSALLLCYSTIYSSPGQDETLYWSAAHRLQFSDFQGRAARGANTENTRHEGRIAGTIIKSVVADTRRINGRTYFIVYASMKPKLSWISKKGDSTALRHEQGHFDICEVFARRLRSEIGGAASVDEAKKIWNRVLDEEDAEQNRYDKANTYLAGGITESWLAQIRKELKQLERFSDPEVLAKKLK